MFEAGSRGSSCRNRSRGVADVVGMCERNRNRWGSDGAVGGWKRGRDTCSEGEARRWSDGNVGSLSYNFFLIFLKVFNIT